MIRKVAQPDLVFGVQLGFISRFMHARLQVSTCSGYDLCQTDRCPQTHRQHFDQVI